MKNKNALYIVLGIGAGVVAYYLFCKKKNEEKASGEPDAKKEDKSTPSKVVSGGGFTPVIAPILTPVSTTPIVVNITKPAITKPSVQPVTPIATITPTTPTTKPSVESVTPIATISPTTPITKPSVEPVRPIDTQPISSVTTAKVGFDGGQQCFEVGECLYDL
jgi:hypothetical protein